jgi:hypothetical protein
MLASRPADREAWEQEDGTRGQARDAANRNPCPVLSAGNERLGARIRPVQERFRC